MSNEDAYRFNSEEMYHVAHRMGYSMWSDKVIAELEALEKELVELRARLIVLEQVAYGEREIH